VRTSELRGTALDWAVAKCEGWQETRATDATGSYPWLVKEGRDINPKHYRPSTNWALGGPIIEREGITILSVDDYEWCAAIGELYYEDDNQRSPTPLVAAMRCYVASKLGEEVAIPYEDQRRDYDRITD
jgi:hypothetical protein